QNPTRKVETKSKKEEEILLLSAARRSHGRMESFNPAVSVRFRSAAHIKDNKLSLAESSQLLDACLASTQASQVYAAFRKLQDHREYAFIVEMPKNDPAPLLSPEPARLKGIRLNGISGAPPRALAIINGKTLAIGESAAIRIEDHSLTIHCRAITANSATIDIDGIDNPQELYLR
ncbi:MAG TPA: hypothetical protein VFE51_10970, partial [Verrucomicrobiae bacterium]|nr:hypothetical protein [Verrucomicrobiae bacterium]